MMSFLVTFLYLAELASSARVIIGVCFSLLIVVGVMSFLNYYMNEYNDEGKKDFLKVINFIKKPFLASVIVFVLLPSPTYFYTVAGAITVEKGTTAFFETSEGKKIRDLINQKLDESLAKIKKVDK